MQIFVESLWFVITNLGIAGDLGRDLFEKE